MNLTGWRRGEYFLHNPLGCVLLSCRSTTSATSHSQCVRHLRSSASSSTTVTFFWSNVHRRNLIEPGFVAI